MPGRFLDDEVDVTPSGGRFLDDEPAVVTGGRFLDDEEPEVTPPAPVVSAPAVVPVAAPSPDLSGFGGAGKPALPTLEEAASMPPGTEVQPPPGFVAKPNEKYVNEIKPFPAGADAATSLLTPDAPGIGDDLSNISKAVQRGTMSLGQSINAIQLSEAVSLDVARGELEKRLAAFDSDPSVIAQSKFVSGKAYWDRHRNEIASQIQQIDEEKARLGEAYVADRAKAIAGLEKKKLAVPATGGLQDFHESKDWMRAFSENPIEITAGIIAESLPQMAPGLVAAATTGPAGGAAVMGASSFGVEYASGIIDSLREQGADIGNPESLEAFFSDPEKMRKAKDYAVKRGVPVAAFDALSVGLAGKMMKKALGKGAAKVAAASVGEMGLQAAAGASGEAAAQLASKGEIHDGRSIFSEAIAEVGTAFPEAYGAIKADQRKRAAEDAASKAREAGLPAAAAAIEANPEAVSPIAPPAEAPPVEPPVTPPSTPTNETTSTPEPAITPATTETVPGAADTELLEERGEQEGTEGSETGAVEEESLFDNPEYQAFMDGLKGNTNEPAQPIEEPEVAPVETPAPQQDSVAAEEGLAPEEDATLSEEPESAVPVVENSGNQTGNETVVSEPSTEGNQETSDEIEPEDAATEPDTMFAGADVTEEEYDGFDDDPVISYIMDNGGLLSRKGARKKLGEAWGRNKGEYDDVPALANPRHNKVYKQGTGMTPDEAAAALVDAGLLPYGADYRDLWQVLGDKSKSAEALRKNRAGQTRGFKQAEVFRTEIARQDPGDAELTIWQLNDGDVIRIGGQDVKVTGSNGDEVFLDGGKKFGTQKIDGSDVIYGKKIGPDGKPIYRKASEKPPVEPPADVTEEAAENVPNDQTSTQNKVMAAKGIIYGLGARLQPLRHTHKQAWAKALQKLTTNPNAARDLMDDMAENHRTPDSDVDQALLAYETAVREKELDVASAEVNALVESGSTDDVAFMEAVARRARAEDAYVVAYETNKLTGTDAGRVLNARKMMVNKNDFSLANMLARERANKSGGKPLTPEQKAEADTSAREAYAKMQEMEKTIAALEAEIAKRDAEETFQNVMREHAKEAASQKKKGGTEESFLSKQAKEARARIRARMGYTNVAASPAVLTDLAIIGADYFVKGIKALPAFTQKMTEEFGEWVRPYVPDIFLRSKKIHETGEKAAKAPKILTPKEVLERYEITEELSPRLVFELARAYVRAGKTEMEDVMNSVHADLEPLFEGLTVREVRDAFSGYGKVQYPSKDADRVALREIRQLALLASQLEDAERGIAPKKTGPQRDKATEKVRTLRKRVEEMMKKMGIESGTEAGRKKTALDAVKTRLQNDIEEMDAAIKENKPRASNKSQVEYDQEANDLKARRDAKKKEYDAIFPAAPITQEEQIKKALAALDRSIAEEFKMFIDGVTKRPPNAPKLMSPELEQKRALLDSLRQTRRDLDAAANPKESAADRAMKAALKAAEKAADRYQEMLDTGNVAPVARGTGGVAPTQELEEAWMLRDLMAAAVHEVRKAGKRVKRADQKATERTIKALDKSIAELNRRIAKGDFSPRPKRQGPPTAEVAAKTDIRNALRKTLEDLRKASLPPVDPDEQQLKRDLASIAAQKRKLLERIAKNDYYPEPKKERKQSDLRDKAKADLALVKQEWLRKGFADRLANEGAFEKTLRVAEQISGLQRAIHTSLDASFLKRQGKAVLARAMTSPTYAIKVAQSLVPAWRAAQSTAKEEIEMEEIRKRPLYPMYAVGDVGMVEPGELDLKKLDELVNSTWVSEGIPIPFTEKRIPLPGITHSARAYVMWLNRARADWFDTLAYTLAPDGKITTNEAKLIGGAVSTFLQRGMVGKGRIAQAMPLANLLVYAMRMYISRAQFWTAMPIWAYGKYDGSSGPARKLIAKEYVRQAIGFSVYRALMGYYLLMLAGTFGDDDDEIKDVEFNPYSSDFLKTKIGENTVVDHSAGTAQYLTLFLRTATAMTKNSKGVMVPLAGEDMKFTDKEVGDLWVSFYESKRSPMNAAVSDFFRRHHYGHSAATPNPWTPGSALKQQAPMSIMQIGEIMKQHPNLLGVALVMENLAGESVQARKPKVDPRSAEGIAAKKAKEARKRTPEYRAKQIERKRAEREAERR